MKVSLVVLGFAAVALGHSIFQEVSVDAVAQGLLTGVRDPDSDYPIQDVNDPDFACNKNIMHKDNITISIAAGSQVGALWGHVIGGDQVPNDPDNPIASSHKGEF